MGGIIGGDADLNPVIDKNLYPVFLHSPGKHPSDDHVVIAFNLHGSAAQHPGDDAFKLYEIFFAQNSPLV